ncbi:MAG TPA: DUF924 family protein [Acetobacteraceae bacterium]
MNPQELLDFWFEGQPDRFREIWFQRDDAFDAVIRDRFEGTTAAALDGRLDHWAATPEGLLALVIALDQLPRNLHRGTPAAFGGDARALHWARHGVETGMDAALTPVQRNFLYLPFMHAEDLTEQERCVRLFEAMTGLPQVERPIDSARRHHEVIRRFGRFPHRNTALRRASTPEEEAYVATPGTAF